MQQLYLWTTKSTASSIKTPTYSQLLSVLLLKAINNDKNDRILLGKRTSLQPSIVGTHKRIHCIDGSLAFLFFTLPSIKKKKFKYIPPHALLVITPGAFPHFIKAGAFLYLTNTSVLSIFTHEALLPNMQTVAMHTNILHLMCWGHSIKIKASAEWKYLWLAFDNIVSLR